MGMGPWNRRSGTTGRSHAHRHRHAQALAHARTRAHTLARAHFFYSPYVHSLRSFTSLLPPPAVRHEEEEGKTYSVFPSPPSSLPPYFVLYPHGLCLRQAVLLLLSFLGPYPPLPDGRRARDPPSVRRSEQDSLFARLTLLLLPSGMRGRRERLLRRLPFSPLPDEDSFVVFSSFLPLPRTRTRTPARSCCKKTLLLMPDGSRRVLFARQARYSLAFFSCSRPATSPHPSLDCTWLCLRQAPTHPSTARALFLPNSRRAPSPTPSPSEDCRATPVIPKGPIPNPFPI